VGRSCSERGREVSVSEEDAREEGEEGDLGRRMKGLLVVWGSEAVSSRRNDWSSWSAISSLERGLDCSWDAGGSGVSGMN